MRSLHVWLLTGVLAAAACKPAVREGSTLQSAEQESRDNRVRNILIGGGVVVAGALAVWFGPQKYFGKIKEFPGKASAYIKKTVSDAGSYFQWSNHILRKEFNNAFPKAEWTNKLGGLPYNNKARSALIDHINLRRTDAIDAVKNGNKTVDEVLADDSLRVLGKDELVTRLKGIYDGVELDEGQNLDDMITKMVDTVHDSDVSPVKLKKKLDSVAAKLKKEADTQKAEQPAS